MIVSRQLQFKKIFQRFTKRGADILPDAKYIVGIDHLGNHYFEVPRTG